MRLKDCLEKIIDNRGKNPEYYEKEKYPVIDNVMIKNNFHPNINEATRFIDQETHDNFLRGYLESNLPIMTLVGSGIGNVSLSIDDKSVIVQNTIGFKPKSEILDGIYLYYWFLNKRNELIKFNRGSGQPSIKKTDIENMNINLKDINYQKKVSKVLSNIDKKIELNNKLNNNLQEIALNLFNKEKDSLKVKIGELSKTISKGTTPTKKDMFESRDASTIKYIRVTDFDRYGINMENIESIPNSIHLSKLKRSILSENDLLVSIAGTLGKVAVVTKKLNNSNTNQAVAFIRLKSKENIGFLYFYLKTESFQEEVRKRQVYAVQPNLSLTELGNIQVPLVGGKEKETFNKLLERILHNNEENETLAQIRDTLLPKLMNGEIDLDNIEI